MKRAYIMYFLDDVQINPYHIPLFESDDTINYLAWFQRKLPLYLQSGIGIKPVPHQFIVQALKERNSNLVPRHNQYCHVSE